MKLDETHDGHGSGGRLSAAHFRDSENRRVLRQLPLFQPDDEIPDRFDRLLAQLEAIERGSRGLRNG